MKIVAEIILALVIFFCGGLFWQLRKRAKFLRVIIGNGAVLAEYISRNALDNASPMITPFAEKKITYALNVQAVIDADVSSQRRPKVILLVIVIAALGGSWFLGPVYFVVSLAVFFFSAASPISDSAQRNALQHVLALALILDRWRAEDPVECEEWLEKVPSLRPLYKAVRTAS